MPVRKIVVFGIVAFIIYYLISDPGGLGNTLHSAWNGLVNVGQSLSGFINSL